MFAKTSVRGSDANPLFAELARATTSPPRWNFHKYLIARDGKQVQAFDTRVAPADPKLVGAIEKLLGE
jgi:glutathione peroxidase